MEDSVERSAREDLAMIRRLMEQSRRTVEQAAPHFVIWGVLITVALLATFANAMGAFRVDELWIWVGAVGTGWVASLALGARAARHGSVKGPGGRIMAAIWIGVGVALTLMGFVGAPTRAFGEAGGLFGAMAAAIGAACWASAAVQESRAFRLAAAGWWIGAAAMFVWPGLISLLIMAGLMVLLHLAPGLWILVRSRAAGAAGAGEANAA